MFTLTHDDFYSLLALAWDSGAYTRANTPPEISVQEMNPYRKRTGNDL